MAKKKQDQSVKKEEGRQEWGSDLTPFERFRQRPLPFRYRRVFIGSDVRVVTRSPEVAQ